MSEESSLFKSKLQSYYPSWQEANQGLFNRIKKNKNIQKYKVQNKRSIHNNGNLVIKTKISKEHKKKVQKEKNRIAAQLSRDRQKLYLESLQCKIVDLERQVSSRLCSKCKFALFENSTSSYDNFQMQSLNLEEPENNQFSVMNYEQDLSEIYDQPLFRDHSRSDLEWGNIGKYFSLILMVLAVFFVSGSVENTTKSEDIPMARVLTQHQVCVKQSQPGIETFHQNHKNHNQFTSSPFQVPPSTSTKQIQRQTELFKQNPSIFIEKCKNHFLNIFFKSTDSQSNSFDQDSISHTNSNKTDPTVPHEHVKKDGNHLIYKFHHFDRIYQNIAEDDELKKVMVEKCQA